MEPIHSCFSVEEAREWIVVRAGYKNDIKTKATMVADAVNSGKLVVLRTTGGVRNIEFREKS